MTRAVNVAIFYPRVIHSACMTYDMDSTSMTYLIPISNHISKNCCGGPSCPRSVYHPLCVTNSSHTAISIPFCLSYNFRLSNNNMSRFTVAVLLLAAASVNAFTGEFVQISYVMYSPFLSTLVAHSIPCSFRTTVTPHSVTVKTTLSTTTLFEQPPSVERGVSIDQDGKSNVWAIEPKMEVDSKSSQEKTSALLTGGAAFAAFAVAAGAIVSNLPDPSQF